MGKKRVKIEDIIKLKKQGLNNTQIGKLLGVTSTTIWTTYKKYKTENPQAEEEIIEEKPVEKKKPTKPWDALGNPWSLDMLRLDNKKPGFRQRFFRNNPENIEKRQHQGWAIANRKDYGLTDRIAGEEGRLDSAVRRRELVLMEIPEELAQKRDAYIRHKINRQTAQKSSDALREHQRLKEKGLDLHLTVEKDTLEEKREFIEKQYFEENM